MENRNNSVETLHDAFVQVISKPGEFIVDFDEAWQWIGYSTKQKALEMLEKNFVEKEDFLTSGLKSPRGGRPANHILLAVDCFKSFCMLAQTERGKEVRRYYIRLEKQLHLLGAGAINGNINPAQERKDLVEQIAKDREKVKEYIEQLKENPVYIDYQLVFNRLTQNENRLKALNKETVTQLNWIAEQEKANKQEA